jgi:signal transduction histidine kinase
LKGPKGLHVPVQLTVNRLYHPSHTDQKLVISLKDTLSTLRTTINAEEKVQKRISINLHDGIGQVADAVKLQISTAARLNKDPKIQEILESANKYLGELDRTIRVICSNLLPRTLHRYGLQKGIDELCRQKVYQDRVRFTVKIHLALGRPAEEVELDCYRIVQEFIRNAIEHGKATHIHLSIRQIHPAKIIMGLKDNGIGYGGPRPGGMGLDNITARVNAHRGQFIIKSKPGEGTEYRILLHPAIPT